MNIFDYADYKKFLRDYFLLKQSKNSEFSFGMMARAIGFSTTAGLTMIVNGDRHPGKKIKEKLCAFFSFKKNETLYFADLINLKKYEEKDISLYLALLKKIQSRQSKKYNILQEEIFNRINKWYYFAIREMVSLPNFRNDAKWITKKLNFYVKEQDIERALNDLHELKLIKINEFGKVVNCTDGLCTYDDIPSEAIKSFHRQMIENGKQSIDTIDVSKRYVSGLTIPININDKEKIKKLVRQFEDDLFSTFTSKEPNSVYQFNIQVFPITNDSEIT